MTKGLKEGEPNGRDVYPDIIDHQHWQSPTRPHMSLYDRAAQFSALNNKELELSESALENLNQKLNLIADVISEGHHPELIFTVFVPDTRKVGGAYVEVTDTVKKVDTAFRRIVLMSTEGKGGLNRTIDFDKIIGISGELVDYLDDVIE